MAATLVVVATLVVAATVVAVVTVVAVANFHSKKVRKNSPKKAEMKISAFF